MRDRQRCLLMFEGIQSGLQDANEDRDVENLRWCCERPAPNILPFSWECARNQGRRDSESKLIAKCAFVSQTATQTCSKTV